MTNMIESSRTFLWTEYARGGCGTLHWQGTDPKVWDKLPVCVFSFPFPNYLFIHESPASLRAEKRRKKKKKMKK
jgi:homogentisate 1,2-dioxygenase